MTFHQNNVLFNVRATFWQTNRISKFFSQFISMFDRTVIYFSRDYFNFFYI